MIAAFVDDLLFRSKIRAVASHGAGPILFVQDPADVALGGARLVIVDLDGKDALAIVSGLRSLWPGLRVVGFVSHVHAERIREAREAGGVEVMARSAFVNALPSLLGVE